MTTEMKIAQSIAAPIFLPVRMQRGIAFGAHAQIEKKFMRFQRSRPYNSLLREGQCAQDERHFYFIADIPLGWQYGVKCVF